jgi:hypothetical protein
MTTRLGLLRVIGAVHSEGTKPVIARSLTLVGVVAVSLTCHASLAVAQINPSPVYGVSTAGGSGGTPTGPTNPGALGFGTSTAAGSGGVPTGPLNPNAYGYGVSTAAGSAGTATGPTVRGLQVPPIPPELRIMSVPSAPGVYAGGPVFVRAVKAAPTARKQRRPVKRRVR